MRVSIEKEEKEGIIGKKRKERQQEEEKDGVEKEKN